LYNLYIAVNKLPPNKKGGKNYKKGKHADDDPIVYDRLPGQMYGRVIKLLGGCNAMVYCNDNRERLCHIRGNMRKKVWLSTGDIVLISLRELDTTGNTPTAKVDRGDICAKYDQKVIYKLREKDRTINEKLFTLIEKSDGSGVKPGAVPVDGDDFGFVFEDRDNEVVDESSQSETDDEMKPANRAAQKRNMMKPDDDDINIDDI
jgi:translation initiation factor 1A